MNSSSDIDELEEDDACRDLFWDSCSSSSADNHDNCAHPQQGIGNLTVLQPSAKRAKVQRTLSGSKPKPRMWKNGRLINELDDVPLVLLVDVMDEEVANQVLMETLELAKKWPYDVTTLFERTTTLTRKGKRIDLQAMTESMQAASKVAQERVHQLNAKYVNWQPSYAYVNVYEDHNAGVDMHNDRLDMIGPFPIIAGLSLGACREFTLTSNSNPKTKYVVELPHNSLLVMLPGCQEYWKHSIKRTAEVVWQHHRAGKARVSFTFRMAYGEEFVKPQCECIVHPRAAILKTFVDQNRPEQLGKHFWSCSNASYDSKHSETCNFFQHFDYNAWESVNRIK